MYDFVSKSWPHPSKNPPDPRDESVGPSFAYRSVVESLSTFISQIRSTRRELTALEYSRMLSGTGRLGRHIADFSVASWLGRIVSKVNKRSCLELSMFSRMHYQDSGSVAGVLEILTDDPASCCRTWQTHRRLLAWISGNVRREVASICLQKLTLPFRKFL